MEALEAASALPRSPQQASAGRWLSAQLKVTSPEPVRLTLRWSGLP
jgi:hypothetical protein